jgi:hypothetical protein
MPLGSRTCMTDAILGNNSYVIVLPVHASPQGSPLKGVPLICPPLAPELVLIAGVPVADSCADGLADVCASGCEQKSTIVSSPATTLPSTHLVNVRKDNSYSRSWRKLLGPCTKADVQLLLTNVVPNYIQSSSLRSKYARVLR